jgi:hypothetical protein
MKTGKIIGIILIIASLGLGYLGIDKIANSESSVEILDMEIEATDKSGKEEGYIYTGLAVVLFIGGVYLVRKR